MYQVVLDGVKYTKDSTTGYYLGSRSHPTTGKRERLHRAVWMKHYGVIPKGYEIHHKDEDKDNNDINNLEALKMVDHKSIHSNKEFHKERMRVRAAKNQPLAAEWHSTSEGKLWHKKHFYEQWDKWESKESNCLNCGNEFSAKVTHNQTKFCSNKCKSTWRRKQGLDNESRVCVICEKEFQVNKYSKTKTCSRQCAGKLRSKRS